MDLPRFFETRAHVLACTGPSCALRGGRAVFEATWRAMEERGLAYYAGGSVRLTESGCQGACSHGPNAIAYYGAPDGRGLAEAWYAGMTAERLTALVEALDAGRSLPEGGRYDPHRDEPHRDEPHRDEPHRDEPA